MEPKTPLVVLFDKLRKGGKTYYYTLGQYIVAPNNDKTQEISETLEFTPVLARSLGDSLEFEDELTIDMLFELSEIRGEQEEIINEARFTHFFEEGWKEWEGKFVITRNNDLAFVTKNGEFYSLADTANKEFIHNVMLEHKLLKLPAVVLPGYVMSRGRHRRIFGFLPVPKIYFNTKLRKSNIISRLGKETQREYRRIEDIVVDAVLNNKQPSDPNLATELERARETFHKLILNRYHDIGDGVYSQAFFIVKTLVLLHNTNEKSRDEITAVLKAIKENPADLVLSVLKDTAFLSLVDAWINTAKVYAQMMPFEEWLQEELSFLEKEEDVIDFAEAYAKAIQGDMSSTNLLRNLLSPQKFRIDPSELVGAPMGFNRAAKIIPIAPKSKTLAYALDLAEKSLVVTSVEEITEEGGEKIRFLVPTYTVINALPISVERIVDPIWSAVQNTKMQIELYRITFITEEGKVIEIGPEGIQELVKILERVGGLVHRSYEARDALNVLISTLDKLGVVTTVEEPLYPGFYRYNGEWLVKDFPLREVSKEELNEALEFLEKIADSHKWSPETWRRKFGGALHWAVLAPFSFAMKFEKRPWLPNLLLVGSSDTRKTFIAKVISAIWGRDINQSIKPYGSFRTVANLAANLMENGTFPLTINEAKPFFDEIDKYSGEKANILKSAVESLFSRDVYKGGVRIKQPAYASLIFTMNGFPPENDAIRKRFFTLVFNRSEMIPRGDKRKIIRRLSSEIPENQLVEKLSPIGVFMANYVLDHWDELDPNWREAAAEVWRAAYEFAGREMPDWMVNAELDEDTDFEGDYRELIANHLRSRLNAAFPVRDASWGLEERIKTAVVKNLVPELLYYDARENTVYVYAKQLVKELNVEFIDSAESIAEIMGWEVVRKQRREFKKSFGKAKPALLRVEFERFMRDVLPDVGGYEIEDAMNEIVYSLSMKGNCDIETLKEELGIEGNKFYNALVALQEMGVVSVRAKKAFLDKKAAKANGFEVVEEIVRS